MQQQLPERSTKVIRVEPTAAQIDMHNGFRATVNRIVSKRYLTEIDLLRLQKAQLMCRMSANSTYLVDKQAPDHSSKLKEIEHLLGDLAQEDDRKIILFSEWTTMLDLIEPLIEKHGWDFVRLDGKVPQKVRGQLVQRFQQNPDCRLFLATNAGATGLNLQAANTVINVDLPWNPALLEQRIARAHRMGQKQAVQVYIFVTEQTLEENLLQTLSSKHELALAALDPDKDNDAVELRSGIEELELLLGNKPHVAEDEVQKQRELAVVERQQKLADSGGQLLTAACGFIQALLPQSEESPQTQQVAYILEKQLMSSVHQSDDGKLQLRLNLPDEQTVEVFAQTLARLFQAGSTT
ncbi:MAG: SNF2 family DNA or RNA helicase [Lentisphaeria bacterium]